jgi:hypothetical protein
VIEIETGNPTLLTSPHSGNGGEHFRYYMNIRFPARMSSAGPEILPGGSMSAAVMEMPAESPQSDGSPVLSADTVPDGYGSLERYCAAWGRGFAAVRSWARSGRIPAIKVGRRLLVKLDATPPNPFRAMQRPA